MDQRKTEVSRDLDSYIAQRRKGEGWGWFGKQEESKGRLNVKMEPGQEQESVVTQQESVVQEPVVEEQSLQKEYKETSEKRSFFHKVFSGLKRHPSHQNMEKAEDTIIQEETGNVQDLQELARIALRVMKKLPPEELTEYKSSEDFERMKELLRKHKIIK